MQVILIQDVNNLGGANELVSVKNGYARNYLIPSKFAVEASPSNRKQLEEKHKQMAKKEEKLLAELNSVISVLQTSPLKIGAKTGTTNKIFGRVTSVQIARAIKDQKGYEIDRHRHNRRRCFYRRRRHNHHRCFYRRRRHNRRRHSSCSRLRLQDVVEIH